MTTFYIVHSDGIIGDKILERLTVNRQHYELLY